MLIWVILKAIARFEQSIIAYFIICNVIFSKMLHFLTFLFQKTMRV